MDAVFLNLPPHRKNHCSVERREKPSQCGGFCQPHRFPCGNYDLIHGVLRQAGVHQRWFFKWWIWLGRLKRFHPQPPPNGKPRIAILSYSGHRECHHRSYGKIWSDLSPSISPNSKTSWRIISGLDAGLKIRWITTPRWKSTAPFLLTSMRWRRSMMTRKWMEWSSTFCWIGIWSLNMKEILPSIKKSQKPILFWLIGPEKGREPTRLALEEEELPTFYEIIAWSKWWPVSLKSRRESEASRNSQFNFKFLRLYRPWPAKQANEERILDEHESKIGSTL